MKLYQSWKRYGGDTEYVPPMSGTVPVGGESLERIDETECVTQ